MNHKVTIRLWLIVVSVALGLLPTISLQAQEPGFTETFDDPSLPGWEHSPNAAVVDGVLRIEPGNFAFRPGEWGDLTLTVRARRSGKGVLLVHYRASDAGDYHVISPDSVALNRGAGGVVTELAVVATTIAPDEWVQVDVTVIGSDHTVAINGEPILTATDPNPLPPGAVAFEALGEAMGEFDDLMLTASGEALPSEAATPTTVGAGLPTVPPEAEAPVAGSGAPAYQSESWVKLGGPPGGIGYDIRMRPDNPDIMFVTDVAAGVHKSVDGGKTWFQANEGIPPDATGGVPIFCLTIDPHDYDTIWAGTYLSGHLYRSTDNGATWEQRDNGITRGTQSAWYHHRPV